MNSLKTCLGDYMFDNYNHSQQGVMFLKTNNQKQHDLSLPLKDNQIKVTKRDQVLVEKQKEKQILLNEGQKSN